MMLFFGEPIILDYSDYNWDKQIKVYNLYIIGIIPWDVYNE